MVQCYYNHEKNKLEVNFMDSCDGYGRSRKHGAFSCEQGTAVCGKWRPYFDLLCIEIYAEEASCDASFVLPFTLHLKDENEKGDLDYEQEIFRTGRIIS